MENHQPGNRFGEDYKEAAFNLYYSMGSKRGFSKLYKALLETCGKAPSIRTLEKWSSVYFWSDRIKRAEKITVNPELTQLVRAGALSQFRAKEELREFAGKIIRKAEKELDDTKSYDPVQMLGVQRAVESAVSLIKEAEVLEGNVSDRIATEQTLTVDDRREQSELVVSKLFAAADKVRGDESATTH